METNKTKCIQQPVFNMHNKIDQCYLLGSSHIFFFHDLPHLSIHIHNYCTEYTYGSPYKVAKQQ